MKQIKILIIIIIILIIIFGMKILGVFENKEKITLEQVKEMISKSENINNYIYISNLNGMSVIKKYKNNKEVMEYTVDNIKYKNYIDYEKNKMIVIEENNKNAIISKNYSTEKMKNMKQNFEYIIKKAKEYKYIGEEKYNNNDCIIIELKYISEEDNKTELKTRMWISKEYGVILKQREKINDQIATTEFKYEFGCVTDEDIQIPDLSDYEIIENNI